MQKATRVAKPYARGDITSEDFANTGVEATAAGLD